MGSAANYRYLSAALTVAFCACISTETEQKVRILEEQKLEREVGLVDHPTAAAYVEAVGARLARYANRKEIRYRFHLVDMEAPNTFALPGGLVYITRGLLALIESEDELAGILAHEIGHIESRHATRRLQALAPFAILNAPAKLLGSVAPTLGQIAEIPSALAGGLAISAYSRSQEHEADKVGAALAAAAGWRPDALADALNVLEAEHNLSKEARGMPTFFTTHPTTPDRVTKVRSRAKELAVAESRPLVGGHSALLHKLDGLSLGKSPNNGTFVDDRFIHTKVGATIQFPAGWKHRRLPQALVSIAPKAQDVGILVQIDSEGSDPVAAAKAHGLTDDQIDRGTATPVNGLPAFRYAVTSADASFALMWIAFRDRIFLVTGRSQAESFYEFSPTFSKVFTSFRRITPPDLEKLRETRLRIREAEAGESLAEFNERTQCVWETKRTAVTNRLKANADLSAGQELKVALDEAFAGLP
jgi:predicted Zn-dependent protease